MPAFISFMRRLIIDGRMSCVAQLEGWKLRIK